MVRKILLILTPLFVLTVIFIILVIVVDKRSGKGAIQITSLPTSSVYLDSKYIGKTPLCRCQLPEMLPAGTYKLKLVPNNSDLAPFEQEITVSPNVLTAVDRTFDKEGASAGSIISLSPINDKKTLELLVISFPNKVQVFVDNNLVGTTPISLTNLTPSDHDVKLSKDGYKDKLVKIRTISGYRLETLVFMGIDNSFIEASASPAASVLTKVKILQTPTGFLRVRENSSSQSAEVAQVNPGASLELIEEKEGWYKIKLSDGNSGWISSQYAEKQ